MWPSTISYHQEQWAVCMCYKTTAQAMNALFLATFIGAFKKTPAPKSVQGSICLYKTVALQQDKVLSLLILKLYHPL